MRNGSPRRREAGYWKKSLAEAAPAPVSPAPPTVLSAPTEPGTKAPEPPKTEPLTNEPLTNEPPKNEPPKNEPRKKKRGLLAGAIFGVVVLVLLAATGLVVYQKFYADPTKNAVAGNCLANLPVVAVGEDKDAKRTRVVNCNDA